MVKIWEVDYTSFSGSTPVAYDNVGSQHLASYANIIKASPLPGFIYRGGVTTSIDGVVEYYDLAVSAASNGRWTGAYNYRSFVTWVYRPNSTTESAVYLWADGASILTVTNGLRLDGAAVALVCAGTVVGSYTLPTFPGWYCVIATIDRVTPQSKLYVNGVIRATSSTVTAATATTISTIGNASASRETAMSMGYTATYNHILTQEEVTQIYNDFLVDRTVADPYQSVSGFIYGANGEVVSGAKISLLYSVTDTIVALTTSSGDGSYSIDVPYSGNYTLIASSTPSSGATAVPTVVTSSGVFFP